MSDPFAKRALAVQDVLLEMEQQAEESELFALGYMIPQIGLVQEMADYEANDVEEADFDNTYWHWLQNAFVQDNMNEEDQHQIQRLWERAVAQIPA